MTLRHEDLCEILDQAAKEPLGLVLRTSDFARARAALYAARSREGASHWANLQFRASPFADGDLVICKGAVAGSSLQLSSASLTQGGGLEDFIQDLED